jgi:cation/acetate symporter
MADLPSTRLAHPRVGVFFGIFASLLLALGLIALLLEALDISRGWSALVLLGGPVLLYASFALAVATNDPHDFFAAGRRVPSAIAGSTIALTALGGTGLVSFTGALFVMGSDAFALLLGVPAGVVVAGVLFMPYLRKFGAYTIPSYLGTRLDSRLLQITSALVFAGPACLIIVAELVLARQLLSGVTGLSPLLSGGLAVGIVLVFLLAGGMRAAVWSSFAKLIAATVALVLPVTIAALYYSNVPVPQLTAGSMARGILRIELFRDVPLLQASPWMVDLPGDGLDALGRRFLQMFGSIGASAYALVSLIVLAGVAGMPSLLMRATTTPSVSASRAAVTWSVVLVGFLVLTIAAIAVYARSLVTEQVLGMPADRLPAWFQSWIQRGIAAVDAKGSAPVSLAGIAVQRDQILPALSSALGLPWGLGAIAVMGAFAACLACAAAHLQTLAASLSEDLALGRDSDSTVSSWRLIVARVALLIAGVGLFLVSLMPADPLSLLVWALTISAATSFPLLALSVLWKRLTAFGALAGLFVGSVVVILPALAPATLPVTIPMPLSAVFATPLAFLTAIAVSLVSPAVGRHGFEMLRDMRVPGGETLMDRQRRLLRLQRGD